VCGPPLFRPPHRETYILPPVTKRKDATSTSPSTFNLQRHRSSCSSMTPPTDGVSPAVISAQPQSTVMTVSPPSNSSPRRCLRDCAESVNRCAIGTLYVRSGPCYCRTNADGCGLCRLACCVVYPLNCLLGITWGVVCCRICVCGPWLYHRYERCTLFGIPIDNSRETCFDCEIHS
jgi:hypothetical protein